jgi:arsenate reductase (thioredoxin)
MTPIPARPYRVLFLCTGNSARSQIAEALLNHLGGGRFLAESAGSHPVAAVNPYAIEALRDAGIDWAGHPPRSIAGLERQDWDFVITVCDRARESCPIFPGQPVLAHWGMTDPADVAGDDQRKRAAFFETLTLATRRIRLFLALPMDKLEKLALEARVKAIGQVAPDQPVASET